MSENMVRTQVYLPRDVYDWLKERADAEGTTMAVQIREALAEYVVEREDQGHPPVLNDDDPIWGMIGMITDGPEDAAENHDKYIYRLGWESDD